MTVIVDSGPLIHLALVRQFFLLKEFFPRVFTIPQVFDEVVTAGKGRPGSFELEQAIHDLWIRVEPVNDVTIVDGLIAPQISDTDAAVVACAIERKGHLLITDDMAVRELAASRGLLVIGTVGIFTKGRLQGLVPELKPLLDELVNDGYYLNPRGRVYQDALKRVGEI